MVQITELLLAVLSGLLALNAGLPRPQVWLLFLIATGMAGLGAIQRPSLDAMLPRLVERDELTAAGALHSLQGTVGMIAGPAIGGVLVASSGLVGAYSVDVATFVISLVCLWLMQAVPPPPEAERPSLARVREGLRYAWSRPELLGTYSVDMVAMFFGGPTALFPALATHFGGPGVLGLLYAAPALGGLLATMTSGWTARIRRHGMGVIWSAATWGMAIVLFGLAPSLPVALACLVLSGTADMLSGIFRTTIWNQTIPDALRGRLASIEMVSYSSGPTLGNVESGLLASSSLGLRGTILSGGLLCVAGVGKLALLLPRFRAYDARLEAGGAGWAGWQEPGPVVTPARRAFLPRTNGRLPAS
jgi:MFS family permease